MTFTYVSETLPLRQLSFGRYIVLTRVGFLPKETYFFRDGQKKVEESVSSGFLPSKSGRKWKKPENNGRNVSNVDVMWTKHITYINK